MKAVTVLIPAYNPGAFLRTTLDSVSAQTCTDWQCIVIDDGSREDLSFVDTLHPQIRRIRQENRGVSIARNVGLMESESEYVAFLDADDLWLPDKLETQLQVLAAAPNVALCHTAFEVVDENGVFVEAGFGRELRDYRALLANSSICTSTVVVRRAALSVVGGFDPLLSPCEDYAMWLGLARFYELAFVPSVQAQYRVHSHNASGNPRLMASKVTRVLEAHRALARERGDRLDERAATENLRGARIGWGCKAYDKSRACLRRRDLQGFAHNLRIAFELAPRYTTRALLKSVTGRKVRASEEL